MLLVFRIIVSPVIKIHKVSYHINKDLEVDKVCKLLSLQLDLPGDNLKGTAFARSNAAAISTHSP